MGTENLSQESLDAPKPAPPPADYIPVDLLPAHALERIEHLLSQEEKDTLDKARIAGRDAKRAAAVKDKAERDASSKRAADAVKEVVERGEQDGEEEKQDPALLKPGAPAFELEVPETLTPSQQEAAKGYAEDVAAIATQANISQVEAQVIYETAMDIAATVMPSGEEPNLANADECLSVMNSRWGVEETQALIADSSKAVARLGADVRAWLNTPNEVGEVIGNSPAAVYALAMYQRGVTGMTALKATMEVERLRQTPEYQQGKKAVTDKVALLMKISTRFSNTEPTQQQPKSKILSPQEVMRGKVEQEIAAIRKNPDYINMTDTKKRAPLVKRMGELMTQVYGA